jgi:hypothetical protein
VVSTGAQRRIVWVSAPGDYATFNSNHTPDGTSEAPSTDNPAVYFNHSDVLATAGYPTEHEYRLRDPTRLLYVRLFPTHAGQPSVSLSKLAHVFDTRKPCPMSMIVGGIPGRNRLARLSTIPKVPTPCSV